MANRKLKKSAKSQTSLQQLRDNWGVLVTPDCLKINDSDGIRGQYMLQQCIFTLRFQPCFSLWIGLVASQ